MFVCLQDKKYLLSLLLADAELLVTCPLLQDVTPTTATTTPPSDSGQVLQYPQYPHFPMVSQYSVFPGPTPPPHTPAPIGTMASLPQHPQVLLQTLKTKNHLQLSTLHFYSCHSIHSSLSTLCLPNLYHQRNLLLIKTLLLPRLNYLLILMSPFPFPPQFPMVPGFFSSNNPSSSYSCNKHRGFGNHICPHHEA